VIRPREHLRDVVRTAQPWLTRRDDIRLDLNELVPHLDEEAFADIVARLEPWMFTAYPEVRRVYDAVSTALGVTVDHVVLTSGADAGIRHTLEAFCDPGDAVVIAHPTYAMYEVYARLLDLDYTLVDYHDDFTLPVDELLAAIGPSTKVLCLANPNGAIGCAFAEDELDTLFRSASSDGVLVLLDEAYAHFVDDPWPSRIDEYDNVAVIRTFSKAWGIAGLRFGYVLTNPEVQSWVAKMRPNVEINSVAAAAATYLLEHPEVHERAVANWVLGKRHLAEGLRELGFDVYEGFANFVQVRFAEHDERVRATLGERRIRFRDQSASPLLNEYTRITVGPVEVMEVVIAAVHDATRVEVRV
jgi:histidinol-phosphate aminotransferase